METLAILKQCPLFVGIADADIPHALACLSARERRYAKGEAVFLAGQRAASVGIVLSGGVHVEKDDYWGNRTILAHVEPGGLFAEAFVCAGVEKLPVSVTAAEKTGVMLVDYNKIVGGGGLGCAFHSHLVQNMLRVLAQKNVYLTQKMEAITQRTTREKLLAYLSAQARQAGSSRFTIPFNRQELADYLSVERSAMSAQLSQMQRDGLLRYDKNQFELAARP